MGWLILAFTVIPFLECYLMYVLGQLMGFWPTVGLIFFTGIVGAVLTKHEGFRVWRNWKRALAEGRMPEEGILGGVLVLIGGILLITPGVLTDIAGIVLLVPPTRRIVARIVRQRLEKRFGQSTNVFTTYRVDLNGAPSRGRSGDVIDTDGEVVEERRAGDARAVLQED